MKRVKYSGNRPEYVDGFPKDCERSCKGAIHLLPNAIRDITDDEYDYIKKQYPKLRLQLLPKEKPAVKKVKVNAASKPSEAKKLHMARAEKKSEGESQKKSGAVKKTLSSSRRKKGS